MAEWFSLGRVEDIPVPRGRSVEVSGLRLAIFREGSEVVILSDRCPHAGGSLGQGWVEDGEVVCPLHRWRFKLADGRCTTMRGQGVHRFPAEVRGEELWVLV
jgi:nitrite reductase/ring-hydroxylating ferredoxin subunit